MSVATSKGSFQPDSDVHITYEDQQRINEFARYNARFEDFKEDLKNKKNELKDLQDAEDELTAYELLEDENVKVPIMMGEIFVFQSIDHTKKHLEEMKDQIENDIKKITPTSQEYTEVMSTLKAQLYAKFGNHINLEADDE